MLQERLGYNVTEGLGGGTPDAIYALMGCRDPTNANDPRLQAIDLCIDPRIVAVVIMRLGSGGNL